jgi:hypothetical protein
MSVSTFPAAKWTRYGHWSPCGRALYPLYDHMQARVASGQPIIDERYADLTTAQFSFRSHP